ncbi:MAG: HAMP domain-containing histidine kinase [Nitrospirae bacterium]|nr:HAMP domain-containing histidine kinase [Nitrospirota bacterium]
MRNIFKLNFRKKIFLAGALGLFPLGVAILLLLPFDENSYLTDQLKENGSKTASLVTEQAMPYLQTHDYPFVQKLLDNLVKHQDVLCATIFFNNRTISSGEVNLVQPVSKSGDNEWVTYKGLPGIKIQRSFQISADSDLPAGPVHPAFSALPAEGRVMLVLSTASIGSHVLHMFRYLSVFLALSLGLVMTAVWVASGRLSVPLNVLARKVVQISVNPNLETDSHNPDEIETISLSIQTLQDELAGKTATIQQLQKHRDEFIRSSDHLENLNKSLNEVILLKNNLFMQVSHEIKTPINSLSTLIQSLKKGGVPPVQYPEYLSRMEKLSNRIVQVLQTIIKSYMSEIGKLNLDKNLLNVSRIVSGVIADLHPLLNEKGLKCIAKTANENLEIVADQTRLEQILLNLLHNAIKASVAGGEITLAVEETENDVIIHVTDSGGGVPVEKRPHLFTTIGKPELKGEGSGIGLIISKYLVELHGGRIWLEAPLNHSGSTFSFSISRQSVNNSNTPGSLLKEKQGNG